MKFRKVVAGREILELLIQSVVTEEEVLPEDVARFSEELLEEEVPFERPTSLKIYYLKASITPPGIKDTIIKRASFDVKARHLIDKFSIEIIEKETPYWLLIFKERGGHRKEYGYLIRVLGSGFWEVLSDERSVDVAKTFKRLIEVSSEINMVWVSRKKLDTIVENIISPESIRGFTAKINTLTSEKKVTLLLYGGDKTDLAKARKDFLTEPIAILFRKTNSPTVAISGSITSESGIRIDKILPTAVNDFYQVIDRIQTTFIEKEYNNIFEGIKQFGLIDIRNNEGKIIGQQIKNYSSLVFKIPDKFWDEEKISDAIRRKFVEGEDGGDYIGYKWGGHNRYLIYDISFGGLFKLRILPDEKSLVVSPDKGVSDKSLSNFCTTFMSRIEHSATISAIHGAV